MKAIRIIKIVALVAIIGGLVTMGFEFLTGLWIFLGGVAAFVIAHGIESDKLREAAEKAQTEVTVTLDNEFSIAGINRMGLDDSILGDFEGLAVREPTNPYDPNAVAIYIGTTKVGYIPRESSPFVSAFVAQGGGSALPCEGYVAKATGGDGREFYYGKVSFM